MYPAFRIKLLFIFLFCLTVSRHYAIDSYQSKAVEQVRKEIAASILQKHAAPIQTVLKRYKIYHAVTFSGVKNYKSLRISDVLPKRRPAKVSPDEWRSLRKSSITLEDAENSAGEFTLLDLDEDGLRDLIVESYIGGTGLFSYVYVYRRVGGEFISNNPSASAAESANRELYSINGRGADQEADWVRINGRVYLAYRSGEYGKDELLLMRAFALPAEKLEGLIVDYSYRHTLLRKQKIDRRIKGQPVNILDNRLYTTLQKALTRIQIQSIQSPKDVFGSCPLPKNLPPEKQEQYSSSWFGPAHYTFDIVADFPIFEENKCFMARLISAKGSYLEAGRYISTALWLLRSPESEQEEYEVHSTRIAQSVRIGNIENPF